MRVVSAAAVVAAGGISGAAWADQVMLGSVGDNTLYYSSTGALSNGSGEFLFAGTTGQPAPRRGLIRFDVSSIPPGSTVTSATLTLTLSKVSAGALPNPVDVHRVTREWGEGASDATGDEGSGAPALPGDATWVHTYFDTGQWTNAGGDYAAAPSASTEVGIIVPVPVEWTSPGLTADVQGWVDNANSNYGWLLIGAEGAPGTSRRFNTRENHAPGTRPVLTVVYTPPCYANCDGSTAEPALNVADFGCFLQRFAAGHPYANCDGSTAAPALNVADFGCFLQKYALGCP